MHVQQKIAIVPTLTLTATITAMQSDGDAAVLTPCEPHHQPFLAAVILRLELVPEICTGRPIAHHGPFHAHADCPSGPRLATGPEWRNEIS